MFNKNQRVVCINADFIPELWEYVHPLVKDKIYTIRDIVPGISIHGEPGNITVYLAEIHNTVNSFGIERGYNAERFAPLLPDLEEFSAIHELEPALSVN